MGQTITGYSIGNSVSQRRHGHGASRVGGTANRRQRAAIGHHRQRQARRGVLRGSRWVDRSKQYTIVDWKTGKKPRKKDGIQKKLAQLDMYRILLSAMEGVPLTAIDACLYYLSEPIEGDRQLNAADKTEEEILAELSYGIPEQSDND